MTQEPEPIIVADITSEEREEAKKRFEDARDTAVRKYNASTHRTWVEYESKWKPLKEAWEAFQRPHFLIMQEEILAASKQRDAELTIAGNKRPPIIKRMTK